MEMTSTVQPWGHLSFSTLLLPPPVVIALCPTEVIGEFDVMIKSFLPQGDLNTG